MTDEFEKALRLSLRSRGPGKDLSGPIIAQLDADSRAPAPPPVARPAFPHRRAFRSRWLPAALAACLIAGVGLVQMRQHALAVARANHARAQLLQALSIASNNVNIVRAAVAREENPDT
jgi:hypothetical protein